MVGVVIFRTAEWEVDWGRSVPETIETERIEEGGRERAEARKCLDHGLPSRSRRIFDSDDGSKSMREVSASASMVVRSWLRFFTLSERQGEDTRLRNLGL